MPLLHRRTLLLTASIALPAHAYELSRRRIAGLAAATTFAPRIARADKPAVDAEMLAKIQKSRDAFKENSARRGFAFDAGASMPFAKEGTVGAPDKSTPNTFAAPRPKSKRELRKEALAEAAVSGLPDGWVEVTDDSGRVAFYGNTKTGEQQPERPQ